MKRYVLFFLAWASTLSLFAENPRYFRELYDENAPLEQRYNYLLGKRISVEKDIAFFYDESVKTSKQNSDVWDLEAKLKLIKDLDFRIDSFIGHRTPEEWAADKARAIEMEVELFRDIYEEYQPKGLEGLQKQLKERIKEYIATRTQESHEQYLRARFARERNKRILRIHEDRYLIDALANNFRDNLPRMLELYDRSLLEKRGLTLSRFLEIQRPYEKQLIQQLKELEEEKRLEGERKNPTREELSMPSGISPRTVADSGNSHTTSSDSRFPWLPAFFGCVVVLFVGLSLWLKIRSRNSRVPRKN